VNAPAGDFTISVPSSVTVTRKTSKSVTVTVTALTTNVPVTLSISGVPRLVSTSFTPNPATATGSSTLKITVNNKAATGNYNLVIKGTAGSFTHTAALTLTIN